jgi:hypothetical protein
MTNTDEQIATILARYGEPATGNVWQAEGETFIHHRTLERIAGKAKITFDPPVVLRAERDEAVLLVVGRMDERVEWSIGEALVDVNYDVPRSEAAYVYAMAEKRAKDRVILKLIELSDVVSSEEPHAAESLYRAEQNQATRRRKFRPLRWPLADATAERKSREEKPLRPVW